MNHHHMKHLRALRAATASLREHFESLLACNEHAEKQDAPTATELLSYYNSACDLHTRLQDCIFDFGHGHSKTADIVPLVASFTEKYSRLQTLAHPKPKVKMPAPAPQKDRENPRTPKAKTTNQRLRPSAPPPPSDPTRITTGRHLKRLGPSQLQGIESTKDAAERFYRYTADTHGGKVRHGKKHGSYLTRGGKRIRKK